MKKNEGQKNNGRNNNGARFDGWRNAILLLVALLTSIGAVYYGYATIFPAMVADLGWDRGEASIAQSLLFISMGVGYGFLGLSIKKLGPRYTILSGLIALVIATFLLATVTSALWQFILLWGVVCGPAFALSGIAPAQILMMNWFDKKRSSAIGFMMIGGPLGGFIAQDAFNFLISEMGGWRTGWLGASISVSIAIICVWFLVDTPAQKGQFIDGIDPENAAPDPDTQSPQSAQTYRTDQIWTLRDIFANRTVYLLLLVLTGHIVCVVLLISHGVLHFTDNGQSAAQGSRLVGIILIGSGLARFPSGWIGDRIEPTILLAISVGVMLAAQIIIWQSDNFALLSIACCLLGICYGGQLVWVPVINSNFFGSAIFPQITSITTPVLIGLSAIIPWGAGAAFDYMGHYDVIFGFSIAVLILSFIASLLVRPPRLNPVKQ